MTAYPDELFIDTPRTGVWGMDLVLPCRYAPGPLANDPGNFYRHTWSRKSVLEQSVNFVPSNNCFKDNNSDFSLTLLKLNPVLALYSYECDIDFLVNNVQIQPYLLRDSFRFDFWIDVMIDEIEGECMKINPGVLIVYLVCLMYELYHSYLRPGGY